MNLLHRIAKHYIFHRDYARTARRSDIILSAGMPRSGSTWLYNAARLLLQRTIAPEDLATGWIGDWPDIPRRPVMLIKVHDYHGFLPKHSRRVLYSFRDIRDVLASLKRKFGVEPKFDRARQLLTADCKWRKHADLVIRYETMMTNPASMLDQLADVLRVPAYDGTAILQQVQQLEYNSSGEKNDNYHRENLLHTGHITDGRHGSWDGWLTLDLLRRIDDECGDWLEGNGYMKGHTDPCCTDRDMLDYNYERVDNHH